MNPRRDNFTSTVDGAAAFERWHSTDDGYDDRPTLAEIQRDEWEEKRENLSPDTADYDEDGECMACGEPGPDCECVRWYYEEEGSDRR